MPTIITPGSVGVKRQAEREGLHDIFQDAGALWTHSSCGPCLGMSVGVIAPGTRVVSSTNRNFPGRMGDGGRVHLASPQVVAASAILGRIASPSDVPARAGSGAGMIVKGPVLPIPRPNIDTDQIIPAKHLTTIDESGMGEFAFTGMTGGPELLAAHPGAVVWVAGENVGCGSSREHAVWAIAGVGIKAGSSPRASRASSTRIAT